MGKEKITAIKNRRERLIFSQKNRENFTTEQLKAIVQYMNTNKKWVTFLDNRLKDLKAAGVIQ